MKYAFYVQFESNVGSREAWVYASSAEEARRLVESANTVVAFAQVTRHEASKILCYTR